MFIAAPAADDAGGLPLVRDAADFAGRVVTAGFAAARGVRLAAEAFFSGGRVEGLFVFGAERFFSDIRSMVTVESRAFNSGVVIVAASYQLPAPIHCSPF